MNSAFSDVDLLQLIQKYGTLEIWTNKTPKTYNAGNVFIGSEGDKDSKTIQELIHSGHLEKLSEATNCLLYKVSDKGRELLSSFQLS